MSKILANEKNIVFLDYFFSFLFKTSPYIKKWRKIRGEDVKNNLHKYGKEAIIITQKDNLRNVKMMNLETQNIKIEKIDFKNCILISMSKVRRAM